MEGTRHSWSGETYCFFLKKLLEPYHMDNTTLVLPFTAPNVPLGTTLSFTLRVHPFVRHKTGVPWTVHPNPLALPAESYTHVLGITSDEWNEQVGHITDLRNYGFHVMAMRLLTFIAKQPGLFGTSGAPELLERLFPATTLTREPSANPVGKVALPLVWQPVAERVRAHFKLNLIVPVHLVYVFSALLMPQYILPVADIFARLDCLALLHDASISAYLCDFPDSDPNSTLQPTLHVYQLACRTLQQTITCMYDAQCLRLKEQMRTEHRLDLLIDIVKRLCDRVLVDDAVVLPPPSVLQLPLPIPRVRQAITKVQPDVDFSPVLAQQTQERSQLYL